MWGIWGAWVESIPFAYFPCYMAINIPTREELIANKMSLQQLAEHLGKTDYFFFFNSLIVSSELYTKTSLVPILLDETGSKDAICGACGKHGLSRYLSPTFPATWQSTFPLEKN